jgi:5-methylcytosine-specific restriction protein A
MSQRLLKPCSYPGCPNLTRVGRCPRHPYPVFQRDPARQSLYDARWRKRREQHLIQHPWCEDCLEEKRYVAATIAHHEERHEGNVEIFLSSPLRSLCESHHNRRTLEEVRGKAPKNVS